MASQAMRIPDDAVIAPEKLTCYLLVYLQRSVDGRFVFVTLKPARKDTIV